MVIVRKSCDSIEVEVKVENFGDLSEDEGYHLDELEWSSGASRLKSDVNTLKTPSGVVQRPQLRSLV